LKWKQPGTTIYYIQYVFDNNNIYITGDVGYAVVRLTEKATLKALSKYLDSISYFIEKIECSSDKYDFDKDTAIEYLKKERKYWAEDTDDKAELNKISEVFDKYIRYAANDDWERCMYDVDLYDDMTDIDVDAWEWLSDVGKVYGQRVIMWLVGLKMAYEQIERKSV
jgi:hypothetical protein